MRTPYDKSVNWAVAPIYRMVQRGYVVNHSRTCAAAILRKANGIRSTRSSRRIMIRSNGLRAAYPKKVGMMERSYVGATQMHAAIARPPHLGSHRAERDGQQLPRELDVQGGAFEQWFDQNWTSQLAQNTLQRLIGENTNALVGAPTLSLANYPVFNFGQLPAERIHGFHHSLLSGLVSPSRL